MIDSEVFSRQHFPENFEVYMTPQNQAARWASQCLWCVGHRGLRMKTFEDLLVLLQRQSGIHLIGGFL